MITTGRNSPNSRVPNFKELIVENGHKTQSAPSFLERDQIHYTTYQVNDVVIDFSSGTLIDKYDQKVKLEPLVLELLAFMVKHSGCYLTCDDLMAHVWSGRIVSENAVRVAVKKLRDAMGDDPREPRFIKTVPHKGYLFIANSSLVARHSKKLRGNSLFAKISFEWIHHLLSLKKNQI